MVSSQCEPCSSPAFFDSETLLIRHDGMQAVGTLECERTGLGTVHSVNRDVADDYEVVGEVPARKGNSAG